MIGQTILHYKILEKLGEGGMGVVFKAQDTKLDRLVALKFLPARLSASEQDKARFVQEAKAAAALNHPNVCSIIDIQEQDGNMFIVMEYVDGQTLREKTVAGQVGHPALQLKQCIEIGIQIADGLAAAHEKGIVHRDIKPENIMIRKDGIAQIMDFGLAKLKADGSKITRLTKEGSTLGTAGYMSPEQVQGQDADNRSDIFSLGVLLYEMFTGRLPFQGAHETAMQYEIVNVDPPPPSVVRPDLDPELDRIILECLQKERDERYNSAKDIAKDLKRFKRESSRPHLSRITRAMPVQAPSEQSAQNAPIAPSGRRLSPLVWVSMCAVIVVLAAFWLFGGRMGDRPHDIVKFVVSGASYSPLENLIAISPDGKNIGYVGSSDRGSQLFVRALSELDPRPVSGTDDVESISGSGVVLFSPDGEWLGYSAAGRLKKIPVRGGSSITICTASQLRGASWGDDNMIVYAPGTSGGLWRVSADGGTPLQVTTLDSAAGEISHRYPEVLPGSKAFLYTVKTNSITKFSDAKIAVQRFDGKEKKILIDGGSYAHYISTGHIVYGQGASVFAVPFDLDRLELKGQPVKILDGGMFVESYGSMTLSISKSGTLVYAPGGPTPQDSNMLVQFDRKGNAHPLVDAPGGYASVSISPDQTQLAYYQQAANDDIWIYDVQRRLRSRFTFAGGNNWYPMWSPDGKHIVFTAERGSPPNIFWKSTVGAGAEERLTSGSTTQFPTGWSPDGKNLVYHQTNEVGDADIWILPIDPPRTAHPFLQTKFSEQFGTFSPDGRWMAYESNESGQWEIYATSFPKAEGKLQISTGGGIYPKWTKHGSEIVYYNVTNSKFMSVPISYTPDLHAGRGEELFKLSDDPMYMPDVSADGERIAVALPGKHVRFSKLIVIVNWFAELEKQLSVH